MLKVNLNHPLHPHRDISTVKGSESFFKKSLEKIHEKRVCPACSRGFNNQDDFEKTIKVVSATSAD